jgi:biotin carboxylase
MDSVLILGAGVMQGPLIRCAREMGLRTVVVDGDPNAPMASGADYFKVIDLKNKEEIAEFALSLKDSLRGVITAGTDFSASVAWTAEKLGLPGIPYRAALDASDKERMRRRFAAAGLPSPAFFVAARGESFPEKLPFAFPAVVKPVDNMGGRGCRRVDNPAELAAAAAEALKFSRSGRAIVEEYIEGPEFSVDAVIYHGEPVICGLADRHIFFPPCFIEMGHTMPALVEKTTAEALIEVFLRGVRVLGITDGAAKGDIKLSPRGPMIGEIAARLSGGYMSGWTYPYASGAQPIRGALCAALGRPPEGLVPLKHWTSAERAFISIPGTVHSVLGLEEAKHFPHIKDLFLRIGPGTEVHFPENNVSKAGNVISAAEDRESAVSAAEEAARSILIRLAAPNPETAAFLAGAAPFPPSAYTPDEALRAALRAALARLPETGKITGGGKIAGIIPFPAFTESNLLDYMGRTPRESLEAVRKLTGLPLLPALLSDRSTYEAAGSPNLGRGFWAALIRGGYQGGAYYIDLLMKETGN